MINSAIDNRIGFRNGGLRNARESHCQKQAVPKLSVMRDQDHMNWDIKELGSQTFRALGHRINWFDREHKVLEIQVRVTAHDINIFERTNDLVAHGIIESYRLIELAG